MTLPARSSGYWFQWATFHPAVDFWLGSSPPKLEDMDLTDGPRVPQLSDADILTVTCDLNPTLFEDNIPKMLSARTDWTTKQRNKAKVYSTIHTADELTAWVS